MPKRNGGFLHQHIAQANRWKAEGQSLIIAGSQYSAAAVQVAYAKRIGIPVTYKRRWGLFTPMLYFHAASFDGKPVAESYERLIEYLGLRFANIIGVPPVKGWRKLSPEAFDITRSA